MWSGPCSDQTKSISLGTPFLAHTQHEDEGWGSRPSPLTLPAAQLARKWAEECQKTLGSLYREVGGWF